MMICIFTGMVIRVDEIVMDCTSEGESFKMAINTVNECLDASCDASKYNEHIDNLNSNPEVQELMNSMGLDCTFSSAYHLGLGAGMVAIVLTISMAVFV